MTLVQNQIFQDNSKYIFLSELCVFTWDWNKISKLLEIEGSV